MVKRCEIDAQYKWHIEDIISNEEEYEKIYTEVKMLLDKIANMQGMIVNNAENLQKYLETSMRCDYLLETIYVYSYLYHYQDMSCELGLKYKNKADKLVEEASIKTSFTRSELLSIPYEKVKEYLKENKDLEKYAFTLEKIFRYQSHTLSTKEEQIIAEAGNAFGTPDEVFSCIDNVDINLGKIKDESNKLVELTNSNYIKFMSSKNRNVRKQAFNKMYKFFGGLINTLAATYKGVIKEDFFSCRVRKFNNPLEQSLYSDNINTSIYEKLIEEVHHFLPLMYRYFKVRNKYLGIKSHLYDIYTDLGELPVAKIPYDEGIKHVIVALSPLGEEYIKELKQAFTDGWVDVYNNEHKRSGAYQWGVYKIHPYVSLNYEDNYDSVSTLAHELGHAMHSYYSDKSNDYHMAQYPIFLAEIASTVNEVLIDDYFYNKATSDEERIVYLSNFLDKVRATIYRQTMFAEFESIVHDEYQKNTPITAKYLCDTYYDLNKLYFGKNVVIDENIKYEWARIPHFYTPFYVYKYATGLIVALIIASDILSNIPGAKEKYLKFLKSGASDYPLNILAEVGIDISDSATIKKAFKLIEDKLEQLESLINKDVLKDE